MDDYTSIHSTYFIKDETRIHIVGTCGTMHIIIYFNIQISCIINQLENHWPSAMAGSETVKTKDKIMYKLYI